MNANLLVADVSGEYFTYYSTRMYVCNTDSISIPLYDKNPWCYM